MILETVFVLAAFAFMVGEPGSTVVEWHFDVEEATPLTANGNVKLDHAGPRPPKVRQQTISISTGINSLHCWVKNINSIRFIGLWVMNRILKESGWRYGGPVLWRKRTKSLGVVQRY